MANESRSAKYIGFTILVGAMTIAVWLGWNSIQSMRAAAHRSATKDDIKRIMLAMHNYHDVHNSFPPAFVSGPDGERWHSWRALILPYLEPELAKEYRLDEPWNGPHNKLLLVNAPDVFRSDSVGPPSNATSYFAVVGKRTLWPAHQSMSIQKIMDGTSNTIAIVEDSRTDIQWLEPKDLLMGEFFHSFYHGEPWTTGGGRTVGLADGSSRFLSPKIPRDVLTGLLTPVMMTETFKGNNWPADLVENLPNQKLRQPVDAGSLEQTTMLAASSQPMDVTKNQLWAATFQMVWDRLKTETGGPVVLGSDISAETNPMLEQLNASSFDTDSLSPESCFVARTGVSSTEDAALLAALKKKFPDANPPVNDIHAEPGQWGIRLYAMIRKSMPFESAFDRFRTPLEFSNGQQIASVNSFGQDPVNSTDGNPTFAGGQVEVLDDLGDDNFIVQLNSIGGQVDRIILGLVPAETTLAETWNSVQQRIRHPNPKHSRPALEGNETLQIPILDFSIQNHFAELEGRPIAGFGDPARLVLAFLDIRLRLDETGAEFQSSAEVGVIGEFGDGEVVEYKPQRIRRLILNKPFFIAIKEINGTQPWFMAWIANGELMETFVRQP